jgi:hypothetical protein
VILRFPVGLSLGGFPVSIGNGTGMLRYDEIFDKRLGTWASSRLLFLCVDDPFYDAFV